MHRAAMSGIAYLLIGMHFSLTYCGFASPFLKLDQYLNYQAKLPFQARVLPALVYNAIPGINSLPNYAFGRSVPAHLMLYFVAQTLACVLLSVALLRHILRQHMACHPITREIATLALFASIYFSYVVGYEFKYFLPYDLPSLAFWVLIIWLAYERRLLWLAPTFALATLNRETTLLLIPCVVGLLRLHQGLSWRTSLIWGAGLLVIWGACKAGLYLALDGNAREGNGLAVLTFTKNLSFLINPLHWPQMLSACAFLFIPFFLQWRRITEPSHVVFKWTVALTLAVLMVTGLFIEVRIFGEVGVLIILCLSGVLNRAMAIPPMTSSRPSRA